MADDNYDHINPSHYQSYHKQPWEMMVDIWGPEKTALFCEMNAFKYRMRAGMKPDQPISRDYEKERWYLNKAKELRDGKG